MNKNYNKGRRFEYKVKAWLEERDWICVRSAGSKSPFDLVAMKDGQTLPIQCKYGTRISRAEMKELVIIKNKLDPEDNEFILPLIAEGKARSDIIFIEVPYTIENYKLRSIVISNDWFRR